MNCIIYPSSLPGARTFLKEDPPTSEGEALAIDIDLSMFKAFWVF